MDYDRGFVTVATGDYYCWLAENMVMSYKLFSDTKYPMYVMTDKKGEKRLKKFFDGVIVLERPYYTFMDKMTVYQNSPFEETLFVDADSNIVSDISFLFDDFRNNNSNVSCIGVIRRITEDVRPIHFGNKAINHFQLNSFVAFNGGVYYFKKSKESEELLRAIFFDYIPNYKKYQLKEFRNGQMADEPLYGLAMINFGFHPLDIGKDIMKQVQRINNLSWDMVKKKCGFVWYGYNVSPYILHFGTHNTYTKKYVYYNAIVRSKYKGLPKFIIPFYIAYNEAVLLCRHISIKSDRQAFYSWIKSHFTKEHFRYRKQQINAFFKRG